MTDDLLAFLHQQFENQRFRGQSLKTLAFALPPETGAYLTETGELLLAEVDAKRRILDEHKHYDVTSGFGCGICAYNGRDGVIEPEGWCMTVRLLAQPSADRPGYRDEWKP